MGWDFWGKNNNNPFRGGFAGSGTGKLYRNPFTGELTTERQDTSYDSYRRGWENNRCNSSADCGSGHACIYGQCVKVYTRDGSNYQPDTCGDENVQWAPCRKGNVKKGSNDKCGRPTPGDCEKDPVCPGVKCCRQQGDGSIRCVCGPCEQTDWARCNPFCDSYYKSFGEVAAGCYTKDMDGFGECGGNICDECKYCSIHTKACEQPQDESDANFNNLPCWCAGCDEECHACDKDPDSSTFGDCVYSPANCAECCTQYNYECPQCPNRYIPVAHHCEPATSSKPCITALRELLYAQCAWECQNEPDPCAPTGSFSFCEDGTPTINCNLGPLGTKCPNPDGFVCPEGKTCDNAGYLQVNGQTCWFFNTWVTEDIPDECEECDCNCHNDCGDCELCGTDGKCYSDPACDVSSDVTIEWGYTVSESTFRAGGVGCVCNDPTYPAHNFYTITSQDPTTTSFYFKPVSSVYEGWGAPAGGTENPCSAGNCGTFQDDEWVLSTTYLLYKSVNGVEEVFTDATYTGGISYKDQTYTSGDIGGGYQWLKSAGGVGLIGWGTPTLNP